MYNWSVGTTELKKNPEQYAIWHLEQLINFGLNGEKIDQTELFKHFAKLNIEPRKKQYLNLLLKA